MVKEQRKGEMQPAVRDYTLNMHKRLQGVAFKKTFSYAGFEQQPKKFENPKVLALNVELELKAEKDSAEIRLDNPADF